MVIDRLIENLESVDFHEAVKEAISVTRENLKDEQIDQLKHGINGSGIRIGKYKNAKYSQYKHILNPLAGLGNVDLILNHDFSNAIQAYPGSSTVVFTSADVKFKYLTAKYGNILGIAGDNKTEYIEMYMAPQATQNIINQIHK